MIKARDCQLFMTIEDEKIFCKALREHNPNIYFLDVSANFNSDINKRLFKCVSESTSEFFSIVNFDFIDKEELSKRYEKYGDYYHFSQLGYAQMQFLRSHPDVNYKDCLQHGRISDSYDNEDAVEKKWKNKIYSILKKLGNKVYWYYKIVPSELMEISEKPARNIVALTNSCEKYNGIDEKFLISSIAKFVPQGTTLDDINIIDLTRINTSD